MEESINQKIDELRNMLRIAETNKPDLFHIPCNLCSKKEKGTLTKINFARESIFVCQACLNSNTFLKWGTSDKHGFQTIHENK